LAARGRIAAGPNRRAADDTGDKVGAEAERRHFSLAVDAGGG